MAGNIKVGSNGTGGKVMLDETDISTMLMGVDIRLRGGEVPEINFELSSKETMVYEVENGVGRNDSLVAAAIAILRTELFKHSNLYNGFLASIESSVSEQKLSLPYRNPKCIAENILKRIIVEE